MVKNKLQINLDGWISFHPSKDWPCLVNRFYDAVMLLIVIRLWL